MPVAVTGLFRDTRLFQDVDVINWEAAGALGEIAGAAAILVTLMFLARQIRQASDNVKAASHQSASQGRTSLRVALASDKSFVKTYLAALRDPESLSAEDYFRFHVWMVEEFRIAQSAFYLHQKSLADQEFWQHEKHMVSTYKAAPGFEYWWTLSKPYYSTEFIEQVNSIQALETAQSNASLFLDLDR